MLVVMAFSVLALSSCERLEGLFPGGEVTDNHFKNVDMPLVYEIYLDYMEDIGEEPLSYDEWFEAIHGDEFQKGIIPLIEKNENSGFWEISFNNGKGWNDLRFKTENEEQKKCKHTFGKWVTISEGNDYFNGIRYRECKKCDYKDYQFKIDKDAPSHTHSFTTTTADPTCEAGGFDTKTCSCGYTEKVNETAPLGHGYTDEYVSDATYHWKKCVRCDYTTAKEEHTKGEGDKCNVCKCEMNCTYNEYFIFTLLDDNTYSVRAKNVNNMPNEVAIPDTYSGAPVTAIDFQAFCYCDTITNVIIPDSVTSIGERAFYGCYNLSNITIPSSVSIIPDEAFYNCTSINNIVIPDSVTSIGYGAFMGCDSLSSIVISSNITSIEGSVFNQCGSLTNIEIPNGVTSIDDFAFYGCYSLNNIVIPDSVTSIGYGAFKDCDSLSSITIPDSVISIGNIAFEHCDSLATVTIGAGVTSIGKLAFHYCTSLVNIMVNENNQFYKSYNGDLYSKDGKTFIQYAIAKKNIAFYIPNGVACISEYAFYNCFYLISVVIPDSVTSIDNGAFLYCHKLSKITIGNGLASIGDGAFYDCNNLINIEVDKNNPYYKSIDGNLYSKDGKTLIQYAIGKQDSSFEIPNSVTFIGDNSFFDCDSLINVVIPDGIISIGANSFGSCENITTMVFPESLTFIGNNAFYGCSSLISIIIGDNVTHIGDEAFHNTGYYLNEENWVSDFIYIENYLIGTRKLNGDVVIKDKTLVISDGVFNYSFYMTSILIPDSITHIGSSPFTYCESLTDVYYTGTEEEWAAIIIGSGNEWLTNATIHFNYVPEE